MSPSVVRLDANGARSHDAGMDSKDLNQEQLRALEALFSEMQGRLRRILVRMSKRRFHSNEKLRQLVERSCDNLQELRMHVVYRTCEIDRKSRFLWFFKAVPVRIDHLNTANLLKSAVSDPSRELLGPLRRVIA